jgi:hypothetical protein
MSLIDTVNVNEAQKILSQLKDPVADVSIKYYEGDAWQGGDAWIGPRPDENDSLEASSTVLDEIERGLVSKNTIGEVVNRHRDAVIGNEPDWTLTVRRALDVDEEPTQEEQAIIQEGNAALTEWWDKRSTLSVFQDTTADLLLAKRGVIRLFVPPVIVGSNGRIQKFADLVESLDSIYLHKTDVFASTVYTDPDSQEKLGVYAYRHQENLDGIFVNKWEIQGLNDARQTIIKILDEREETVETEPLSLMKHLAIFEMMRKRFATEQVQQLTALSNMALTMMGRNVIQGGFLERILLNAQLPGDWVDDPANPGRKKFEPRPFIVGAGSTNALSGIPVFGDAQRPTTVTAYANPSVVYRDPVDVKTFNDTIAAAYNALLEEVGQMHVLIAKDANASGESRKQAAAEFIKTLSSTKTQVEAAGRWLLETALAMAAQFIGRPGMFDQFRIQFSCSIDLGPISAEDQNTAAALWEKRVIDRTTAMVRVGIDDPDAEEAKLKVREIEDEKKAKEMAKLQGGNAGDDNDNNDNNDGGND